MIPIDIIILGVNGNGLDMADCAELLAARGEAVKLKGFLDDEVSMHGSEVAGYPVLGGIGDARRFPDAMFVNAIGSPTSYTLKPHIIASSGIPPERWATIVHPSASVSPRACLGHGTVILANTVVGARAVIGSHVMVLQNSVVSHDTLVGDFTSIATGVCVSGGVLIGQNAYLGSNCSLKNGVRIGDRALVGLGAVVVADVAAGAIVLGNPARVVREEPACD